MLIYYIRTTITILPMNQLKLRALSSPSVRASRALWKPVACLKALATVLHKAVDLPIPQAKSLLLWRGCWHYFVAHWHWSCLREDSHRSQSAWDSSGLVQNLSSAFLYYQELHQNKLRWVA